MKMHIYLITTEDDKEAYVYSNLSKAKTKEKELINAKVYEWMDLWCRPIDYQAEGRTTFTDSSLVWLQLENAYNQGHWDARVKYPKDIMDDIKVKNILN